MTRKAERGAVLALTVVIVVFVASMVTILASAILFSSRLGGIHNGVYKVKRALTNDCRVFVSRIDRNLESDVYKIGSPIPDCIVVENDPYTFVSAYVPDSFSYSYVDAAKTGGQFKLAYEGYVGSVTFAFEGEASALLPVLTGLTITKAETV